MRFLHTADWHLCDHLGRQDRTEDLRRAVENIATLLEIHEVDVLIIAGDLFSETVRPEELRQSIDHWSKIFGPFLARNGTILAVIGNHDNETICLTFAQMMQLAAPVQQQPGAFIWPGRFYLAAEPTAVRLNTSKGDWSLPILMMPWPTPATYFKGLKPVRYDSPEEKYAALEDRFHAFLSSLRSQTVQPNEASLLIAHVQLDELMHFNSFFRSRAGQQEGFVRHQFQEFSYAALGHIHRPQAVQQFEHVRYSGSIERLDLGEQQDDKSVVLFDLEPQGLVGKPKLIPIPATKIRELKWMNPAEELTKLEVKNNPDPNELVKILIHYTPGIDSLESLLERSEKLFPRWYDRDWEENTDLMPDLGLKKINANQSMTEIIQSYFQQQLQTHSESDQIEILQRLNAIIEEENR